MHLYLLFLFYFIFLFLSSDTLSQTSNESANSSTSNSNSNDFKSQLRQIINKFSDDRIDELQFRTELKNQLGYKLNL